LIVSKRNGNKEPFSASKLYKAIIKLFGMVDKRITPEDEFIAGTISGKMEYINLRHDNENIAAEDIRDFAIKELIDRGRGDVASLFEK